jgi:predicted ATP-grasp superfamily ATP-dependent carboligase
LPEVTTAPPEPILLAAVSARMMAELAVGAGHSVVALDRFGDLDLQGLCESVSLRDLGGHGGLAALTEAAAAIEAPSVLYGGGFENHPSLVDRLATGRELLGNPPRTLRLVRDPTTLGGCLRAAGLAYPRTLAAVDAPRVAGSSRRWLRKPLRGGGGRGVREWRGGRLDGDVVVQERVAGLDCSAAAVADGRGASVLGLSEQLTGRRAFGASGYRWCGNLVPPRLPAGERTTLLRQARAICARLAETFGLRGSFGVDLVWDGERAWVTEVNPRPSASLETIEAAHGGSVFDAHLRAVAGELPQPDLEAAWARGGAAGKAVLYAREETVIYDTREWPQRGVRDIPHPGDVIAKGHPVCTLTAAADSPQRALDLLEEQAAELRAELRPRAAMAAHA